MRSSCPRGVKSVHTGVRGKKFVQIWRANGSKVVVGVLVVATYVHGRGSQES